jgi:hypothetical protein
VRLESPSVKSGRCDHGQRRDESDRNLTHNQ